MREGTVSLNNVEKAIRTFFEVADDEKIQSTTKEEIFNDILRDFIEASLKRNDKYRDEDLEIRISNIDNTQENQNEKYEITVGNILSMRIGYDNFFENRDTLKKVEDTYEFFSTLNTEILKGYKEDNYNDFIPTTKEDEISAYSNYAKDKILNNQTSLEIDSKEEGTLLTLAQFSRVLTRLERSNNYPEAIINESRENIIRMAKDNVQEIYYEQNKEKNQEEIAEIEVNFNGNPTRIKVSNLDEVVASNPDLLNVYKPLRNSYNPDGSKREIDEKIVVWNELTEWVDQKSSLSEDNKEMVLGQLNSYFSLELEKDIVEMVSKNGGIRNLDEARMILGDEVFSKAIDTMEKSNSARVDLENQNTNEAIKYFNEKQNDVFFNLSDNATKDLVNIIEIIEKRRTQEKVKQLEDKETENLRRSIIEDIKKELKENIQEPLEAPEKAEIINERKERKKSLLEKLKERHEKRKQEQYIEDPKEDIKIDEPIEEIPEKPESKKNTKTKTSPKEIDDGKDKGKDDKKEIDDGKDKGKDDKKEIDDGKDKGKDDKKEIDDGKDKGKDDKKEIDDGKDKGKDDKKEIDNGKDKGKDDKKEIDNGKDKGKDDKKEIDNGKDKGKDDKKEIDDGKDKGKDDKKEIDDRKDKEIDELKSKIDTLNGTIEKLNNRPNLDTNILIDLEKLKAMYSQLLEINNNVEIDNLKLMIEELQNKIDNKEEIKEATKPDEITLSDDQEIEKEDEVIEDNKNDEIKNTNEVFTKEELEEINNEGSKKDEKIEDFDPNKIYFDIDGFDDEEIQLDNSDDLKLDDEEIENTNKENHKYVDDIDYSDKKIQEQLDDKTKQTIENYYLSSDIQDRIDKEANEKIDNYYSREDIQEKYSNLSNEIIIKYKDRYQEELQIEDMSPENILKRLEIYNKKIDELKLKTEEMKNSEVKNNLNEKKQKLDELKMEEKAKDIKLKYASEEEQELKKVEKEMKERGQNLGKH